METTRSETLKYCLGFTFLISVLILYIGLWSLEVVFRVNGNLVSGMPASLWVADALFFVGSVASYSLNIRSTHLAGWLLALSVSAGIFVYLSSAAVPYGILAFLLPILFTALLFDWKPVGGFIGSIVLLSILLNVLSFPGLPFDVYVIFPTLVLLAVSIFVELTISHLFSDLEWYEKNYVSAYQKERIIRDNEAKLQRLVKDLKDYQGYLNVTNELLVKARDEAEKAKNAKQVFVQNVSHELRTPLNLIIGFSETMFNTPQAYAAVNWTPELKNDVECIYRNSQHLKSLIDDVLDMASLENKSYEINPANVDLNALIVEAVLITRDSYASKGLYLETNLDEQALPIHADPVRIRQVILNLLSNALKYTARGGVSITSRRSGETAVVDVDDSGKGIPASALEKVFEAFYQVDKSRNRDDSGTGLGLTISRQLVELHGGEMHIDSSLGEGTVVSFSLPLFKRP